MTPESMTLDSSLDPARKLDRQHLRRLHQITRIIQATLLGIALLAAISQQRVDALAILITALALFGVDAAIKREASSWARGVLLVSPTTLLIFLAWHTQGLSAPVVLGFGGVLAFGAMLGERRHLLILFGIISLLCVSILGAEYFGWHQIQSPLSRLVTTAIIVIMLSAITYGTYLMTQDYRTALSDLIAEDARVRLAHAKIEQQSLLDGLTHLPNRTLIERLFYYEHIHATRLDKQLAILIIDLDNLKLVNDSLGHNAGDHVLIEAARRLTQLIPKHAELGHYAGDKFIVMLGIDPASQQLPDFCEKILAQLAQTYRYQSLDVFCSASIGAVLAPHDSSDFDTLLRKADLAVHAAKDNGRNSVKFYEDLQNTLRLQQLDMVSDIQKGIERGEFSLHYQPKIDLHQHKLTGFEALLRWQHPSKGSISPAVFIPLAESSGLIIQLGEWIIDQVCRQIAEWRAAGRLDFSVAINVSCVQFKRGNLAQLIDAALERHGISAHFLEIELTESLIIEDNEPLQQTLTYLRQRGLQLSIDDFGTGYSNLGYLKKFEFGKLKIDQSFIRKLNHSHEDEAIVSAVIQLCNNLGLASVAEGVEDAATAARLRELGCSEGQGYFWSKPLPAEDISGLWESWQQIEAPV